MSGQEDAKFEAELTAFMLVKTMPEWLGLPDDQRFSLLKEHVEPLLRKHRADIRLRF